MRHAKQFFTPEEIRPLAERSDLMGAFLLLHCWGIVFGAMALAVLWPNPLTWLLAIMLIGSRQLGLAILMHDAAHNALFKTRSWNEWAGDWLCGRPILADLAAYRRYHLKHHRHAQTELDPDLPLSKPFPTTRASLIRKLVRDVTGQTGVKQRLQQIALAFELAGEADKGDPRSEQLSQNFNGPNLLKSLLANAALFAVLALAGVWWAYPLFWLLPLLTWYQLVLRVRNIAEHGAVEFSEDPLKNVRTTYADPVTALFLAPYWVNYHLEHHLVMHLPCWRLPEAHRLMLAKGHRPEMTIGRSYWEVLKRASNRPAAA
ncbi:MAG: fatty acid desaturase family protein [Pseudomonadota bacterium]